MDFVTFEIAKKLKEKGFKEQCLAYYTQDTEFYYNTCYGSDIKDAFKSFNSRPKHICGKRIDAPTIAQILRWLREEKKIFVAINIGYCYESYEKPFPTNPKMEPILKGYYYGVWDLGNFNDENGLSEYFESYELAALAGIEYTLDNLI